MLRIRSAPPCRAFLPSSSPAIREFWISGTRIVGNDYRHLDPAGDPRLRRGPPPSSAPPHAGANAPAASPVMAGAFRGVPGRKVPRLRDATSSLVWLGDLSGSLAAPSRGREIRVHEPGPPREPCAGAVLFALARTHPIFERVWWIEPRSAPMLLGAGSVGGCTEPSRQNTVCRGGPVSGGPARAARRFLIRRRRTVRQGVVRAARYVRRACGHLPRRLLRKAFMRTMSGGF